MPASPLKTMYRQRKADRSADAQRTAPAKGQTRTRPGDLLTARQAEIVDVIADLIARIGYPPTIREIAAAMAIRSPQGIKCHLDALRAKGAITWTPGLSRTLRLTPPQPPAEEPNP